MTDIAESTMQKFIFDFLDRFGVSLTIVAVVLILTWKVFPDLSKVLIDKYRAETELVRETQKVIASVPTLLQELKTAIIAELKAQHTAIKETVGAEADKRIEHTVNTIARRMSSIPGTNAIDSEPPSRVPQPSRPG